MKILRPVCAGVAGIFFPIGKPECGGTCQYATDKCLRLCYALDKGYDETVNIPERQKGKIYKFFTQETILRVCNEVLKEMEELQATILSWFCSGDCLDKDVDRLVEIMGLLHDEGVIQNGFTRNQTFYRKIMTQGKLKHIVLTVESRRAEDAPAFDDVESIWAIPNYKTGIVTLYRGKWGSKRVMGYCGFNEVTTNFKGKTVRIASNCLGCYKKKMGCFTEITRKQSDYEDED